MFHRRSALAFLLAVLLALPALAAGRTLFQGTWTKIGYDIAGQWQIVEEGGRMYVVLNESFHTKNAPDLKIFLSPLPVSALNNRNAIEGALRVGPLSRPQGPQRLEIPPGTQLGRYKTIVLHCEQYSKLWGAAPL